MTKTTPATLRAAAIQWGQYLARHFGDGPPGLAIGMREHAAWEADLACVNAELNVAMLDLGKAQARNEVLESDKAAMRLEIVTIIGMYGDHMHPRAKQALEALAVAYPNVALAKEEKP